MLAQGPGQEHEWQGDQVRSQKVKDAWHQVQVECYALEEAGQHIEESDDDKEKEDRLEHVIAVFNLCQLNKSIEQLAAWDGLSPFRVAFNDIDEV